MTIQLPTEFLTTAETIELVDDAKLQALIEAHDCTPETIREIKDYIHQGGNHSAKNDSEDSSDAQASIPLYYTNPLEAEKLATLAYRMGKLMEYPGPEERISCGSLFGVLSMLIFSN